MEELLSKGLGILCGRYMFFRVPVVPMSSLSLASVAKPFRRLYWTIGFEIIRRRGDFSGGTTV